MAQRNYDELLYPILHHQGNIVGFLDTVFDFLYRRTDFFRIKQENVQNFGFEIGEAERLVRSSFCKYSRQARVEFSNSNETKTSSFPKGSVKDNSTQNNQITKNQTLQCKADDSTAVSTSKNQVESPENQPIEKDATETTKHSERKVYERYAESYNGAKYDNYSWAQTIKDLDVYVNIPKNMTSSNQVKVDIKSQHLKVEIIEDSEWKPILDGDLSWKVSVEESAWTLVSHEHIHICLEKIEERWWNSLVEAEPKIDVQKIDATQHYEDLDEDAQAKIQELMYNEHQKRLGKPTIQQTKMEDILREAWNKDGSPFQGQPFDPSIVNFSDSGNIGTIQ